MSTGRQVARTLSSLISSLPAPDVQTKDLKQLVLQYVLDLPNYDPDHPTSIAFMKYRLDAIRLLFYIIKFYNPKNY